MPHIKVEKAQIKFFFSNEEWTIVHCTFEEADAIKDRLIMNQFQNVIEWNSTLINCSLVTRVAFSTYTYYEGNSI